MDDIITYIMQICGVTQIPTTVGELMWDFMVFGIGLMIIKIIMVCVFGLIKTVLKMN